MFSTKTISAQEVLKKLEVVATMLGDPRCIISDRGAALTSGAFRKYCEDRGKETHTIATGIPKGNGQVERIHRVIILVLTKLSIKNPEEWHKYVTDVQKVFNNSWQRAIQTTPFELLLGVKMKTKESIGFITLLAEELQNNFQETRNEWRTWARDGIQNIQEENRKYYNLRRRPARMYQVGDIVALPETQFVTRKKVMQKFYGPLW